MSDVEDPFEYDPRNFVFPKQRERPFRAGVLLGCGFALFLFFEVLAIVFFGPWVGPVKATLIGVLWFLVLILGWTVVIGGRQAWMGSHSPVEWVYRSFLRREAPVPVLDEAPAQLLRKRGRPDEALALYRGWCEEHPDMAILLFRRAEILRVDLKDRMGAARLYRQFASRVRARDYRPTDEERDAAAIAEGLAEELKKG